jgi:hypothetical protein
MTLDLGTHDFEFELKINLPFEGHSSGKVRAWTPSGYSIRTGCTSGLQRSCWLSPGSSACFASAFCGAGRSEGAQYQRRTPSWFWMA